MPFLIIGILLGLVVAAVPVAAVLGILSLSLDEIFMRGRRSLMLGDFIWEQSIEYILVAIPMFILLGEIMLRAGIALRMYNAVIQWLSWMPGGLMHANIGSCAIFAASSGSSVATAATVGTVAYPEIEKHNYNENLFLGSLAAGGTLGILVPPSINLIIYGLLTDSSVPELYLAGIFPGITLAILFMAVIAVACLWKKDWGGDKVETNWAERIRVLPDLLPPVLLFVAVVGSIYAGVATPTEAASIGVVFALLIAAWNRALTVEMLKEAFEGTMRSSSMIMLIILAAVFLNFVLGFMGVTQTMLETIKDLGWTPMETMIVIILFYLLLGMFMETLSMLLTTIPVVFPIVMHLGFDPIWFGIMITVLMEAALITPPIGINLYVVHGIR
ncbi:MAG TPA: TRAP transporter large permease, partial [Alphaproteobacteria bacterium]|nr:TRAP transporter large permease [Alphaproteobacteria bacterium]